jgi:hypothetical protein
VSGDHLRLALGTQLRASTTAGRASVEAVCRLIEEEQRGSARGRDRRRRCCPCSGGTGPHRPAPEARKRSSGPDDAASACRDLAATVRLMKRLRVLEEKAEPSARAPAFGRVRERHLPSGPGTGDESQTAGTRPGLLRGRARRHRPTTVGGSPRGRRAAMTCRRRWAPRARPAPPPGSRARSDAGGRDPAPRSRCGPSR